MRPILLDEQQCLHYGLPPIPMKDGERRAEKFKERYGVAGATELDALEPLHPGEFERIVTQEIERYIDADLDDNVNEVAEEVQADIDDVNADVRRRHSVAIRQLKAEHKKLVAAFNAYQKKARPIIGEIKHDLKASAPNLADYDWPEPEVGDEDDDPMFDSKRGFVEQINRFKQHQKKEIHHVRKLLDRETAVCVICGETFEKTSRNIHGTCTKQSCRTERWRRDQGKPKIKSIIGRKPLDREAAVCIICNEPYEKTSRNTTGTCLKRKCKNEERARRIEAATGEVRKGRRA